MVGGPTDASLLWDKTPKIAALRLCVLVMLGTVALKPQAEVKSEAGQLKC